MGLTNQLLTADLPDNLVVVPPAPQAIAPANPGMLAMQSRRFRINGQTTAELVQTLDARSGAAIRWFSDYCRQLDLPKEEYGPLLRKPDGESYSGDSVYQLLTGKRTRDGAKIDEMINAIEAFRRKCAVPAAIADVRRVPTRLIREVGRRCDRARELGKFMFIFGKSHMGKSTALQAYMDSRPREDYGKTILIEAPVGGSATAFFDDLRSQFSLGQCHRAGELRDIIANQFAPGMLLIIDQGHRFLKSKRGRMALDFLIQLHDQRRFGMVLTMTEEELSYFGLANLKSGATGKMDGLLRQLWNRRVSPLRLPPIPPQDDLNLFAAQFGLTPAPTGLIRLEIPFLNSEGVMDMAEHVESPRALQDRVCANESLGVWLTILKNAQIKAAEQSRDMNWHAVLRSYCDSQADEGVWQ